MPGTDVPQRVTFLYPDVRLGAELLALHGQNRHVTVISSPVELVNGPPPDVVVINVPAPDRRAACEEVRRHHRGPLIVLLGRGESGRDLPPDHNRTLLTHPFSIRQLSVALAMPAPTLPTWDPAAHLQLVPSPVARAGGLNTSRGAAPRLVAQAVPPPARSWRERRLVRVSAISVVAALLFMGAFAVVSQGDHCGPGCDELAGADLVAPSSTTAPLGEAGPDTTGPGADRVDPTTSDPGAGPTANGESRVDGAGTGATPSSATSASLSGAPTPAPDPTSPPGPTRPQPTTAPTTTRPKTSTSTSTSTSTTATTATTTTTTSTRP
jgi:hypothetical protein